MQFSSSMVKTILQGGPLQRGQIKITEESRIWCSAVLTPGTQFQHLNRKHHQDCADTYGSRRSTLCKLRVSHSQSLLEGFVRGSGGEESRSVKSTVASRTTSPNGTSGSCKRERPMQSPERPAVDRAFAFEIKMRNEEYIP